MLLYWQHISRTIFNQSSPVLQLKKLNNAKVHLFEEWIKSQNDLKTRNENHVFSAVCDKKVLRKIIPR